MILFLDFDGVLHGYGADSADEFCELPRLTKLLREADYRHVDLVITSSWRTCYEVKPGVVIVKLRPVEDIQTYFPPDIRCRILGLTPYLGGVEIDGIREREIRQWLADNAHTSRPWIALDDFAHLFEPGCENLIVVPTHSGLDDGTEVALRARLKAQDHNDLD